MRILLSFIVYITLASCGALGGCPEANQGPNEVYQAGIRYRDEKKDLPTALACMRALADKVPGHSAPYLSIGEIQMAMGDLKAAKKSFRKSIEIDSPKIPDARFKLGNILKDERKEKEAIRLYKESLEIKPDYMPAYNNMGIAYRQLGEIDQAVKIYKESIEKDPKSAEPYINLAFTYGVMNNKAKSLEYYEKGLKIRPDWPEALYNVGTMYHYDFNDAAKARENYEKALKYNPKFGHAIHNIAILDQNMGQLDKAAKGFRRALKLDPTAVNYYNSLGNVLQAFGSPEMIDQAFTIFQKALDLDPVNPDTNINMAHALISIDKNVKARKYLEVAIQQKPDVASAWSNWGDSFRNDGDYLGAIPKYFKAYDLDPNFHAAFCNLIYAYQYVSNWTHREENFRHLSTVLDEQLGQTVNANTHLCVHPFMSIAYPLPMSLLKKIARAHADLAAAKAKTFNMKALRPAKAPKKGERIRVGYLGFEYGNYPVGKDMASVFGLHDRSKFEIFAYALNPDDGSPWRPRIAGEVEHFVDFSTTSTQDCAKRIANDKIHILINLSGYTKGERNEIFALRPAPIQVFFKGFAGTSGSPTVDYTINDDISVPVKYTPWYTEQMAYMPHSFFVSDYAASHQEMIDADFDPFVAKRASYGLPEDGIVFGNFNQLYKVDPEILDVWVRILQRVPNSVLWLLKFPDQGRSNIEAEASRRGLDPSRIVWADKYPDVQHLKIKGLTDLFLDTPLYNGHGSVTDLLWAGVPGITIPKVKMASRVAASLVTAIGCPEMVVSSLQEYEDRAVYYATHPEELKQLRQKLLKNRQSTSLFNIKEWVSSAERIYESMAEMLAMSNGKGQKLPHIIHTQHKA